MPIPFTSNWTGLFGVRTRPSKTEIGKKCAWPSNSANYWPVGGAVLNCWNGEKDIKIHFKKILDDRWTAGFHYMLVAFMSAGNDLGSSEDSDFAWFASGLVPWAECYEGELRLVDVVGRSYL